MVGTPVNTREEREADALEFELTAEEFVTAPLREQVLKVIQELLGAFYSTAGRLVTYLRDLAVELIGRISPALHDRLAAVVERGQRLGIAHGVGLTGVRPLSLPPDVVLVQVVASADERAMEQLRLAIALARSLPLDSEDNVMAVAAAVAASVTQAEADTRWAGNRALNQGAAAAAAAAGDNLMWVPERNACLHCLAYAGLVVAPGALFPAGLTYADKPLTLDPAPYPPLHPHCRCRVEPYAGPPPNPDPSDPNESSALAREARRSVARGLSDHASEQARLRAADRLLRSAAPGLPKTVLERARRDVRRGRFTDRPKGADEPAHRRITRLDDLIKPVADRRRREAS